MYLKEILVAVLDLQNIWSIFLKILIAFLKSYKMQILKQKLFALSRKKTVFRLVGGNSYLGESLVTNAFPD